MKQAIIFGLLISSIITNIFCAESDGVFSYKVGNFEVFTLVESERAGNTGILVGADEELLAQLIPDTGFKHTANAFLVKTGKMNILIDTGTGINDIIIDKIKKLGVQPEKIDAILITHLHGDHFGSLQKDGIAVFPKAKIYLSVKEKDYFTKTNINEKAAAALTPYGAQVISFEPVLPGSKTRALLPGISAIANYGHTPGHTVYLIENGKDKLIIAGDFLHIALVQFAFPQISASYDMDKELAAALRRQIIEYAAKNKIAIAGMHIVYPGIGTVEALGEGFRFLPVRSP